MQEQVWNNLIRLEKVALIPWSNYAVGNCPATWYSLPTSYYDKIHLPAGEMYQLAKE